jgi:hypothetical protein
MRTTLAIVMTLALVGLAASPLAAQQTGPGGIGSEGGGIGNGGLSTDADGSSRGGVRRHGGNNENSGGGKRRDRTASTATPPKPGEVVKSGLLKLPEGLGGDKVHTAYLEAPPR